jgi:dihydrofolate synthase/folylpolyglutamate synthase
VSDAIVQRLMGRHPLVITLGLERIERLLERLGSPQKKLPPLVHVAGTNGKGSLVAYLRAMAEAAGYRAHVYTSPHLVRFNERIRIAGRLIEDDELGALLTECEEANGEEPISFFDITTALAFLAFSRVPADLAIIEVGMGGRFDSTNVIQPALSAITPVGYDHTGFLGDTLEKIAGEKAGIIKRATPVVVGRQRDASAKVIEAEAAKLAAPFFRMGREWQVTPTDSGFRYESDLSTLDLPVPALIGAHQIDNAATAVACIERLRAAKFAIDDAAIRKGLASVEWPARLQRLTKGPLPGMMPPGSELWLDGGHNEDCGIVLGKQASEWVKEPGALPLYLVFAMQTTKDASGFLRPLARYATAARAVPFPEGHSAYTPQEACAKAAEVGLDCAPTNDIGAALEDLLASQPAPMRILICGSLYLAGAVLARNG